MQIRLINNNYTYKTPSSDTWTKSFGSNTGYYKSTDGNCIETYTKMFRADLDWRNFTEFLVKHFKTKDKVNIIQFAASDGSEAYSQIISFLENYPNETKFFPIEAYDINSEIIKAAKSRRININNIDKIKFNDMNIDFDRYFEKTSENLCINNDKLEKKDTYKVSELLTQNVNFHNQDMNEILKNYQDNSNTVLMCRNVLNYLTNREIDRFTTLAACNLKKGSLFIIGEYDNPRVDNFLLEKGFLKVMPNVFMQS